MTKYTPGPWRATQRNVTAPETEDRLGMEVAVYGGNSNDNRSNARLISAAPDLLEALQRVLKDGCLDPRLLCVLEANQAIAKATGVTP